MELKQRVALVTGGARRVGRAIALRLASAGCSVAVHYNQSQEEAAECVRACRERGVEAEMFAADLADEDATGRVVPAVLERFGRLDVLVNNASVFEQMTLDEFELGAWQRTLRINLTAPVQLVYSAREALRAARGRVINICDAATSRPWPDHLAYVTSKEALETLTLALSRALAPGVNVVGLAPGAVEWPEEYDAQTRERLVRRIPLQRAGSAEDIAAAVNFVLAEGDYITGAILPIDGGRRIV